MAIMQETAERRLGVKLPVVIKPLPLAADGSPEGQGEADDEEEPQVVEEGDESDAAWWHCERG